MKKALLALLFVAPGAFAFQDVHINGIVEPAAATSVACAGHRFQVQDGGVLLDAAGPIDLTTLAGQLVRLSGPLLPDPACPGPIVLVTSVTQPTATLEACGSPQPGCKMRFRIGPPTVSLNLLAASLGGPGFLDLGDPLGVLFLRPPLIQLGQAGTGGVIDVDIPALGLVGLTATVQGLHVEVGPISGQVALTNPIGLDFVFGPPCVDPSSCGF